MEAFLKRVRDRVADEDYEVIESMTETLKRLSQALEEKSTSLKRLLHYILGAPTETAKKHPLPG